MPNAYHYNSRTHWPHQCRMQGVWFATGSEVARWCLDEVFRKAAAL